MCTPIGVVLLTETVLSRDTTTESTTTLHFTSTGLVERPTRPYVKIALPGDNCDSAAAGPAGGTGQLAYDASTMGTPAVAVGAEPSAGHLPCFALTQNGEYSPLTATITPANAATNNTS